MRSLRTSLAAILVVAALALGPSTALGVTLNVLEGPTRYETAAKISAAAYPMAAQDAILVTGRNWPDALGGTALAGAGGDLLLPVDYDTFPNAVWTEFQQNQNMPGDYTILGGPGAVATSLETWLQVDQAVGGRRYAGADRYETARLVAQKTIAEMGVLYDGTAFVATGENFPDALAAAPLAAANGWPIYLADPDADPMALANAMVADGVTDTILLGGLDVVSGDYGSAMMNRMPGGHHMRLSGPTRYETAVAIAYYGVSLPGIGWDKVAIATGENFPDALCGGVLCANNSTVMLLTRPDALPDIVIDVLAINGGSINDVYVLGGSGAVNQPVLDEIQALLP